MKNIKFRFWNETKKQWNIGELCIREEEKICTPNGAIVYDKITPEQYICKKDKNGVEMYEGDIIKNEKGDVSFIVYSEIHCKFDTNGYYGGGVPFYYQENEVIGNIHEDDINFLFEQIQKNMEENNDR